MGETSLSPAEVQQIVHEMGAPYKGNRYHLLQRNCNAFSNGEALILPTRGAKVLPSVVLAREELGPTLAQRPRDTALHHAPRTPAITDYYCCCLWHVAMQLALK